MIAFALGAITELFFLKYQNDREAKKASAHARLERIDAAVEKARQLAVRQEQEEDSISNACYNGLSLYRDKICRAVYYRPFCFDTQYYRPRISMPQDYDQAVVYGKPWTPLAELKVWCLRHGQTSFALYVDDIVGKCVYYRYVKKGERFHIYEPLNNDTAYWRADEGPGEGWVKVWSNDAYWEKGELHVRDALGISFAWSVCLKDDD